MRNLNICIDIDGTLTSPYHFIYYLNEMYNKEVTEEECTTVDWSKLYEEDGESLINKFHERYMHSYEEAKLLDGVKECIEYLDKENNLYFVTARSNDLEEITLRWLDKNELSNIETYLLGSNHKIDKAKELECDIFIEDNPLNAMQLAQGGIKVLLIEANYNKNIQHPNIIRVKNWQQIIKEIKNI